MSLSYCPNCDADTDARVIEREETYSVKGDPITTVCQVRICDRCEQSIFDETLDSPNIDRFYDVYRTRHGIIAPSMIRALRESYGLSQRALAQLLGLGEVTIHRYESGSLPDEAHNLLLRLLQEPANMKKVFQERQERLGKVAKRKVQARLASLEGGTGETQPRHTERSHPRRPAPARAA